MYLRCAQRGVELHLAARVPARSGHERGERLLDTAAAFLHQRQMHPQGHRGGRQCHSDRRITARRKGPVQRRAQIVDPAAVSGQPFGGGSCLQFGFGPLEKIPIVFGVTSRDLLEFAALREFLERVGPRRLEQPIPPRCATEIRREERLRDKFATQSTISEGAISSVAATVLAACSVKSPAKIARRRRTTRSGSRSSS